MRFSTTMLFFVLYDAHLHHYELGFATSNLEPSIGASPWL